MSTTAVKPPVWKMVKEAVEALGSPTTNVMVRDWILKKYPGTNKSTIGCQTIISTVNHDSRIHYPENKKPRKCDSQYDFLYRPSSGQLEAYDPARHGLWELVEDENGRLKVQKNTDESKPVTADEKGFAAEALLRDFLAGNLDLIEHGLELFTDDNGNAGVEYVIAVGRIDILAIDSDGNFLVVELKVGKGPDDVCGQIMRYVSWVKRHLAKGKKVRGLIIAKSISDKIRYALADLENIEAHEYSMNISLKAVPHIDTVT